MTVSRTGRPRSARRGTLPSAVRREGAAGKRAARYEKRGATDSVAGRPLRWSLSLLVPSGVHAQASTRTDRSQTAALLQQFLQRRPDLLGPDGVTLGAEVQVVRHDLLADRAVRRQELVADVEVDDV